MLETCTVWPHALCGHCTKRVKTVGRMTYIVLVHTLNHAQSINQPSVVHLKCRAVHL